MKRFLLLFSIVLIPLQASAFEDYIITSDKAVKSVFSSDESIVSAVPVFTIDNNKETIIVKAKREGNAEITVRQNDRDVVVKVRVTPEKTTFESGDDLVCFPLDRPDDLKEGN